MGRQDQSCAAQGTVHENRRERNDPAAEAETGGAVTQSMVRDISRGVGQEPDGRNRYGIVPGLGVHLKTYPA